MTRHRVRLSTALIAVALMLAACGGEAGAPTRTADPASTAPSAAGASPSAGVPLVEPPPRSSSALYAPNPGSIVVAIDPGHGGCLDWGVPDPSERGVELSEKQLTLDIGLALRDLLEDDGVRVVMTRDADEALAGDDYPELGCEGPSWRDVNGDGEAGFDPAGTTRTRDELQARLDLANVAQADALVSIHINSPYDGGESIAIAFTETFYTDETPWGETSTAALADAVQAGVVQELAGVARYDRGDRATTAHNFFLVAPPLLEPTEERPNVWAQPTRGGLMPVILSEVGSITLREEHDLLASPEGQAAIARGIVEGLRGWLSGRELAARIGLADAIVGAEPAALPGGGPPFWAAALRDTTLRLRVTNTGSERWPDDVRLVAGWEESDEPYLRTAPSRLEPLDAEIPPIEPGASVVVEVDLPAPPPSRGVAWISLSTGGATLADLGSPALQVSTGAP